MTPEQKMRKTECARLHYQGIDACNQTVLSTRITQEDRENILAQIAAFAQTRLEQCLADPSKAGLLIDSAETPEEEKDEDLSFLE